MSILCPFATLNDARWYFYHSPRKRFIVGGKFEREKNLLAENSLKALVKNLATLFTSSIATHVLIFLFMNTTEIEF